MKCAVCHLTCSVTAAGPRIVTVPLYRKGIGGRIRPYACPVCYQCVWAMVRAMDAVIGLPFAAEVIRILQESRIGREQGAKDRLIRWLEVGRGRGVYAPEENVIGN